MKLDFKEKLVLVTGSSRGIGLGIGKLFIQLGAKVIFNSRNQDELNKVIEKLNSPKAIGIVADVTSPIASRMLIEEISQNYGPLNHIICNVGSGKSCKPGNENFKEWQRIFELNLWSTTNIVESSKDYFVKEGGSITCISSICGKEYIPGAPVTYSVAKAALNSYVKHISFPLSKKGIRINSINPGNILFDGSVWDQRMKKNLDQLNEFITNEVPLERLGNVIDVANFCIWLSSEYASFTTGNQFNVDGGQLRGF